MADDRATGNVYTGNLKPCTRETKIVVSSGIDVLIYAAPEPYEEFEDPIRELYESEMLTGSLDDTDFLRQMADMIEKYRRDPAVGAIHLDIN